LDDALFTNYSFKYLKQISERVRKQLKEANIPEVPMVKYYIVTSNCQVILQNQVDVRYINIKYVSRLSFQKVQP